MHGVGQMYRYEPTGQRFKISAVGARGVTLDPIDRPVQGADTRFVGESFPLAGMWPDDLDRSDWGKL